jgi:hypothetical protein
MSTAKLAIPAATKMNAGNITMADPLWSPWNRRRAAAAILKIPPFTFMAIPTRVFVIRQMIQAREFKKRQQGAARARPKFMARLTNNLFTKHEIFLKFYDYRRPHGEAPADR